MDSEYFDLVRARMDQLTRDMTNQLNADLFRSIAPTIPYTPPTWRERLRWRVTRVCGYFSTLWDALRGRDPYACDHDY